MCSGTRAGFNSRGSRPLPKSARISPDSRTSNDIWRVFAGASVEGESVLWFSDWVTCSSDIWGNSIEEKGLRNSDSVGATDHTGIGTNPIPLGSCVAERAKGQNGLSAGGVDCLGGVRERGISAAQTILHGYNTARHSIEENPQRVKEKDFKHGAPLS